MAAKKQAKKHAKKKARSARKTTSAKRAPAPKRAAKKPVGPLVVHWEIRAKDPARTHDFYRRVFGWTIDANNPMSYGMVKSSSGEHSIDGGIGGTESDKLVTIYIQVPDIDTYLAKVEANGGKTLTPRTDMGPVVMATFQDLEGNEIGLVEG